MWENKNIQVLPIDLEKQKDSEYQYSTNFKATENGKKIYLNIQTGRNNEKWPGFQQSYKGEERKLKLVIDPDQDSCIEFQNNVSFLSNILKDQLPQVFGEDSILYEVDSPFIEPEKNPNKPDEIKYRKFSSNLDRSYNYYYEDKQLDRENSEVVRKTYLEKMNKNKDINLLNNQNVSLSFMEDGKKIIKNVKYGDIEQRNEISTKVHFRKISNTDIITDEIKNYHYKKIISLSEKELVEEYGEPKLVEVKTPEDLDKYYKRNSYVRFMFVPKKVWAARSSSIIVDGKKKRRCGIKFICKHIDIIYLENPYDSTNSVFRDRYLYPFTDKSNIKSDNNQAVKTTVKKADEDEDEDDEDVKLNEEDEEEEDEDDDDDDDDDDDEPEPEPIKSKKSHKVEVKKSKNIKIEDSDDEDDDDDDDEPEPEPIKSKKSSKVETKK